MRRVVNQMRVYSIIVGLALILASTNQLQAQQTSVSPNRLLPAREFLFSSTQTQPANKLRSDMLKLVVDSRAGRIPLQPQQSPAPQVHNLSKTAKIAIVAGVAVVVLTIVVVHGVKNLHCTSRCVL